jgi:hypothetical protein
MESPKRIPRIKLQGYSASFENFQPTPQFARRATFKFTELHDIQMPGLKLGEFDDTMVWYEDDEYQMGCGRTYAKNS